MPWGDGTGPMGYGPMTGRGAGYCAGFGMPGYMNPIGGRGFGRGYGRGWGRGRGFGRGFGRGRGFGWGYGYYGPAYYPSVPVYPAYNPGQTPIYQEPTPEDEKAYLENLVTGMEKELGDIKARIKELTKKEK